MAEPLTQTGSIEALIVDDEKLARDEEDLGRALASQDAEAFERSVAVHHDVGRTLARAAKEITAVITEMKSNDILDGPTRDRLTTEVVAALDELRRNELSLATSTAEAVQQAGEAERPGLAGEAAQASRDLADAIRAIADRMGRIEELAEIVAQLKRIIRKQRALMDKSKKE